MSCNTFLVSTIHEQISFKAAVRNFFDVKIYKIYIISEYTMNPFSKPCFWLVLNHYGTPIIYVYILTILDWLG